MPRSRCRGRGGLTQARFAVERRDAAPVVVLSPHLDDAIFSAWSVLRRPAQVLVVNVCAGVPDPGPAPRWDRMTGATDRAEAVRARVAEDERALALAGRRPLNLGFLDAQYRDAPLSPAEVANAVRAVAPAASELHAPAALGGHPDHAAVREAALALAERGPRLLLYADLPYATGYGWPHWVTGAAPVPHIVPEANWKRWLEPLVRRGARLEPAAQELGDTEAEAKLEAMRAYRTQFTATNGGPFDRLAHPLVLGFELRWSVAL
jgi:LmbE family N-acetylglucosaminyl deacetylase